MIVLDEKGEVISIDEGLTVRVWDIE